MITKNAINTVKQARVIAHMTQKQTATAINSSQEVISRIENGRQDLTLIMAERLAVVLNVEVSDIYHSPAPEAESDLFRGIKNKLDLYEDILGERAGKLIDGFIDYVALITPDTDVIRDSVILPMENQDGWTFGLRHMTHYMRDHLAASVNWSGLLITRRRRQSIRGKDEWFTECLTQGYTPSSDQLIASVGTAGGIVESTVLRAKYMDRDKGEWGEGREYLVVPVKVEIDRETYVILTGENFTRSDLHTVEAVGHSFFDSFNLS